MKSSREMRSLSQHERVTAATDWFRSLCAIVPPNAQRVRDDEEKKKKKRREKGDVQDDLLVPDRVQLRDAITRSQGVSLEGNEGHVAT